MVRGTISAEPALISMRGGKLALSLKPDNIILGPIVMIIVLLIGHGITIFMAALGAFVHPMRLTFVNSIKTRASQEAANHTPL